jgi:hypothetical protein
LKEDLMDTWGTRGFSAAAITGGLLGLSLGMKAVGSELQDAGDRPGDRQPPLAPRRPGTSGGRRHGAPSSPVQPPPAAPASDVLRTPRRSEEYRAAEQTMISPLLSDPSLDVPSGRHGAPADRVGGPAYGAAYEPGYRPGYEPEYRAEHSGGYPAERGDAYRSDLGSGYGGELDADYPRGGHARPVDGVGAHSTGGAHGSDGFLAGNLTALPEEPARSTPEWSAPDELTPRSHQMGQPTSYLAERPVRSVELVGAGRSGHGDRPVGQVDDDSSALGSLDRSDMFGTLSRRYR